CHAVRYVAKSKIQGDIIECGVWRGGSMMAIAMTLLAEQDLSRTLHLFDTFEGMPPPTEADRTWLGRAASSLLEESDRSSFVWAYAPIEEVRTNMASTNYPSDRIRFIRGKVEDTIPKQSPDKISILRLDTDWYESTRHELIHLYPKVPVGGVLNLVFRRRHTIHRAPKNLVTPAKAGETTTAALVRLQSDTGSRQGTEK